MRQHKNGEIINVENLKQNELTDEEWDLLNKISSKTKMDAWFELDENPYEEIVCVVDLEAETAYDLKAGIGYLMEGMDCLEAFEICELTAKEYLILDKLLNRMGLPGMCDSCQMPILEEVL